MNCSWTGNTSPWIVTLEVHALTENSSMEQKGQLLLNDVGTECDAGVECASGSGFFKSIHALSIAAQDLKGETSLKSRSVQVGPVKNIEKQE